MRHTVLSLRAKKAKHEKVVMITAYDYTMARLCSSAGVDMLLVGDSLGMVMLGEEDTVSVTMEEMIHHTRAVDKGCMDAFVVADMPFMSYQAGVRDAMINAGRLMKEGRARAVKLEGGEEICESVRLMVNSGIPVVGHLGLTPQSVNALGGYHVQGRGFSAASKLLSDARALADAGVFALVLECVPAPLAEKITTCVPCLTIGIGAGPSCDGQVLVGQDLLGMFSDFTPKFVRRFGEIGSAVRAAVGEYCMQVRMGAFPDAEHSFTMDRDIVNRLS